jgi:aminopeptidase N
LPGDQPGDLYVWEENAPVATYLATIAVGNYQLLEDRSSSGVQLRNFIFPEDREEFAPLEPKVGEMLDWMSNYLGPYPFETFGYVTVKGLGASIEAQTLVILDENSIDEETMVHELAHMWFGDWVSLNSWGEIWRNEGFATYFALLWVTRDNPALLEQRIADFERGISGQPEAVPLLNPPVENMFGVNSYVKGAIAIHALRIEMGDKAFFQGLRSYFQIYGGGTASEAEFQAVMEQAAGKSLESFFQKWVY